jgi:hypothetical protein
MNRPLTITGCAALFAASTALAVVVADTTHDDPRTALPAPTEDVGAAVVGEPFTPIGEGEQLAADELPTDDFDAGYVSLLPTSDAADDAAEPTAGDAYPWPTDGDPGDGAVGDGGSAGGGTGAVDIDIERLGAELLGSPSASDRYATRFIDLCADNPDSTLCPTGVGGTVLVPFDGESSYGRFDVYTISGTPSPMWNCKLPTELEADEYPVLVNATHPAQIEIEYYPVDDPTDIQTVVVDLTDPAAAPLNDFTAYVAEHGTVPSEGVHHCFVLRWSPGQRSYIVSARGTSFTGETDVLVQRVDFHPRRPSVIVTPLIDEPLKAVIGVPVAVDPEEYAVVRLLRVSDGQTCATIEDAVLAGESDRVVPLPAWGYHERRMSWGDTFVPAPSGWAADVYDVDAWSVNLEESTDYVLCVWWMRSPTRSFDPAFLSITDRESRLLTTPDMARTWIEVRSITAGDEAIEAGSVSVIIPSGCGSLGAAELRIPTATVAAHVQGFISMPPPVVCEFPAVGFPSTTRVVVAAAGMEPKTFVVPTPFTNGATGDLRYRGSESYSLYYGSDSCTSGPELPDCGTEDVSAAHVYVSVTHGHGGPSNGLTDWVITEGQEFDPPDRAPETLPTDIRLDVFSSDVDTIDRDSLQVTANFDRPVTLRASLEGDPCVLGAAPSYSSTTPSMSHTFELDGLCTFTTYGVLLEASDGTTTTSFSGSADQWYGFGRTDGYHVTYTVEVANRRPIAWRELLLASWNVHFDVLTADGFGSPHVLRGEPVGVAAPSKCLEPYTSAPLEAVWGDTVEFHAQVRLLSARIVGRGYCSRIREGGYADIWQDVVSTIPIADLIAGPVTVTVPFSDDGEFAVDLVITANVEE